MAETAQVKINKVSAPENSFGVNVAGNSARVRAMSNNYFAAFFLAVFFTALAIYFEDDITAAVFAAITFVVLPLLAWNDRIVFDGEKLTRTGIIPQVWHWLNRQSQFLYLNDIEQIETQAIRTLKRGSTVFYRYRTTIYGKDKRFVFASGGENYRQMISRLFPLVFSDVLDNRSIELRDYLAEPKKVLAKAESSNIPSAEVLEHSVSEFKKPAQRVLLSTAGLKNDFEQIEKADYLRQLANELRLSGNLLQALEAFRRALHLNPFDGWLIFEFARCLHSYASSERNDKLKKKANAALRLAEIRAGSDGELLSRLGESYFQYGDWQRAQIVFQKTLNAPMESFRSVRGLAEIALREGKIAHVIHHFTTAAGFADTNSLKRWALGETEYFSLLNDDEDYLDREVKRLSRLENIERGKKMTLRTAVFGFATILIGIFTNDLIVNIGWACAGVSLLFWAGLIMSCQILSARSLIFDRN